MATTTTETPKGTTHIRVNEDKEPINFYRVTPVKFNDGTTGERVEYFNYDWESWQGCVNTREEVITLIATNHKSIITL